MASINTIITNISNQNISLFFESKITSFKPEKDVFTNIVKEEKPYSDPVKIGHAELKNNEELLVFTCQYNKELTARSAKKQQFEIAKKVLKEDFKDGAIFIFYDAQGNFRFSFIRRNYGEKGDKKYSTWKRYTYYVNPLETNKTFKERISNCSFNDLNSIQEAFSVEKLTKEFYNELFAWYQWALSDDIGITYPNNTKTSDDDRIKLDEQVIRLITRLLFVWFIKQKKLVPEYLFDTNELEKTLKDFDSNSLANGDYYNAILQNLFFATLNKEISEREFAKTKDRDIKTRFRYEEMFELSESEIIEYFKPIPFLNGGLFECLDKQDADGNNYFLDGFSRNPTKSANGNFRHRAYIPNCLFFDEEKGIIPMLRRYNFTVEENAPNEVQVALDPELLGKVFENLLGAFNPETKETARKQSGSFYTPREIVDYMVDESLINYLQTKLTTVEETALRALFEKEHLPETLVNNTSLRNDIAQHLKAIKILDPACGSGAFPMGILNKMVEVLEKLDVNSESIHDLKLHLIEDCIYGIDIQPIAIQISKLRFFISLVVEQGDIDINKPGDNYGVLTLPNLETKFVSANTLIGIKAKPKQHNLFEDPLIEETKQELLATRHEHFYAKTAGAKKRLREQDAVLRDKLSDLLRENKEFAPEDALQLSQWNPYDQNASSPFFDLKWMFGLEEGFDLMIGNPPYYNVQTLGAKSEMVKYIMIHYSDIWMDKSDILFYFIKQGVHFLKPDGILGFIISNAFLFSDKAKKLRNFLIENSPITKIVNFEKYTVFDSAMITTAITFLQKTKTAINETKALVINENKTKLLSALLYGNDFFKVVLEKDNVFALVPSKIKELNNKIDSNKCKLGTLLHVGKGMETAANSVFSNYNINENNFPKEFLKKRLTGTSIKKYYLNQELFENILYYEDVNYFDDLPKSIQKYLEENINILKKRATVKNEGRIWWKYSRPLHKNYYHLNKIWTSYRSTENCFAYDESNSFLGLTNTTVIFDTNPNEINLKYILALLNSSTLNFRYKSIGKQTGSGVYEYFENGITKLPIPKIPIADQKIFVDKVDEILSLRFSKKESKKIEFDIDIMTYKLYNLKHEEVLMIDPEFSLTQEEYIDYNF